MSNVKRTPHHQDAVLGEESMTHDNTVEFKVGDKVMLRPETKPYTFTNHLLDSECVSRTLNETITYIVEDIHADGDVYLGTPNKMDAGHISPHHLKHAKQDYNDNPYRFEYAVGSFDNPRSILHDQIQDLQQLEIPCNDIDTMELRLAIFNAKPNRTLEEMQEIEKWLLNK